MRHALCKPAGSARVRGDAWRQRVACAAVVMLMCSAACRNRDVVAAPLPAEEAPRRAASSFVHCVEAATSQCIESGETVGGWDAFFLLMWIGGGSPLAILEALPAELEAHRDPAAVQRRFVETVERYAPALRGARCDAVQMQPLDPLIDQVAAVATERVQRLGLGGGSIAPVIQGLAQEAHETLPGGFLVQMQCEYDPHRLWVATYEQDGRQRVIGFTTLLPRFLGGDPPGREHVRERLQSRSLGLSSAGAPVQEGTVHPWLPFPVEVL